jgi:hypothetical protein
MCLSYMSHVMMYFSVAVLSRSANPILEKTSPVHLPGRLGPRGKLPDKLNA